ncbi:hypothetical protein A2318_01115 [Candidatus Uhrbacteria bacterium RIFOXYB2_FULL_45_11]|uniref:Uncharacterized protein n=1 Tax=Candidatus Uhrbacteria bacterium RIFOXYB2_FULL_45_11 TaxID=1802421 RepID=A0A1F7W8G3_9BACT|nr:MAG: hypothetical protein A2318_01115 [Candidatus Uhrbacteria bacterium RIFOXYB2_FULL_45_11]
MPEGSRAVPSKEELSKMETKVGRSERVLGKLGIEAGAKPNETTEEHIARLQRAIWEVMMDDDKWNAVEFHVGRMAELLRTIDTVTEQLAQLEDEKNKQKEKQKLQKACEILVRDLGGSVYEKEIDSVLAKLEGDPKKAEKIAFALEMFSQQKSALTERQDRVKRGNQLYQKWRDIQHSQSENSVRRQGGFLGIIALEETRGDQEALAEMSQDNASKEERDQIKDRLRKAKKQIQRSFERDAEEFRLFGEKILKIQKVLDKLA